MKLLLHALMLALVAGQRMVQCSPKLLDPYSYEYPSPTASPDLNGHSQNQHHRRDLYFVLMMSSTDGGLGTAVPSSGAVPGVQLALDHINNATSGRQLLPGYTLHYKLSDSQCSKLTTLDNLLSELTDPLPKQALIGAGCPKATKMAALASQIYNITQISCASSSPELANHSLYSNYFQFLPSTAYDDVAESIVAVIRHFGWKHIGIVVQDEPYFTAVTKRIGVLLRNNSINFTELVLSEQRGYLELQQGIESLEARIIVVAMFPAMAQKVICEAWLLDYRYPTHLFLTFTWYEPQWWATRGNNTHSPSSCDVTHLESVLEYGLAFTHHTFPPGPTGHTHVGLNGSEFLEQYSNRLDMLGVDDQYTEYAQHCYDATWALALALNHTIADLESNATLNKMAADASGVGQPFALDNSTYNNSVVQRMMMDALHSLDFNGVTGRVQFDASTGTRVMEGVSILQYRNTCLSPTSDIVAGGSYLTLCKFGVVNSSGDSADAGKNYTFFLLEENESSLWKDGLEPYDGTVKKQTVAVSTPVLVIVALMSLFGCVYATVCLLFNAICRNKKLIRLTSPNMNYFIAVGCLLIYSSIIIYALPLQQTKITCVSRVSVLSFGYTLCLACILVKMWRVFHIFASPSPKSKVLKDWHLCVVVVTLMTFVVCVIAVYVLMELLYPGQGATMVANGEMEMSVDGEQQVVTHYFTHICDSIANRVASYVLFGYLAILHIGALYMSYRTRKVKVKGLDDSKHIAAIVYVTSVLLVLAAVFVTTLTTFINVYAVLFSTVLFTESTVMLSLVFVPKMIGLRKDPHGRNIFSANNNTTNNTNIPPVTFSETCRGFVLDTLKRRVETLEAIVAKAEMPAREKHRISTRKVSFQEQADETRVTTAPPLSTGPVGSA